jgi:hypothetical protein
MSNYSIIVTCILTMCHSQHPIPHHPIPIIFPPYSTTQKKPSLLPASQLHKQSNKIYHRRQENFTRNRATSGKRVDIKKTGESIAIFLHYHHSIFR